MKQLSYFILPVLVFFAQALGAETVYKGTDANGRTIYSDQPFPNSEKITITITPSTQSAPTPQVQTQPTKAHEEKINYTIRIVEPTDQQTFGNEITAIEVKLNVTPKLSPKDRIHLEVNGQPFGEFSQATNFMLSQFPRGAYRIKAIITTADDLKTPIAQSDSITIYQQRAIARRDVGGNLAPQAPMAPQAP